VGRVRVRISLRLYPAVGPLAAEGCANKKGAKDWTLFVNLIL